MWWKFDHFSEIIIILRKSNMSCILFELNNCTDSVYIIPFLFFLFCLKFGVLLWIFPSFSFHVLSLPFWVNVVTHFAICQYNNLFKSRPLALVFRFSRRFVCQNYDFGIFVMGLRWSVRVNVCSMYVFMYEDTTFLTWTHSTISGNRLVIFIS